MSKARPGWLDDGMLPEMRRLERTSEGSPRVILPSFYALDAGDDLYAEFHAMEQPPAPPHIHLFIMGDGSCPCGEPMPPAPPEES